jgi:hypothetical protein
LCTAGCCLGYQLAVAELRPHAACDMPMYVIGFCTPQEVQASMVTSAYMKHNLVCGVSAFVWFCTTRSYGAWNVVNVPFELSKDSDLQHGIAEASSKLRVPLCMGTCLCRFAGQRAQCCETGGGRKAHSAVHHGAQLRSCCMVILMYSCYALMMG